MNDYLTKLFGLDCKNAIVTGAAHGNGKAIANALSNAGCNVIGVDIFPCKEPYYKCDLNNTNEIHDIVQKIKTDYKHIDILVNNAGVSYSNDDSELKNYKLMNWQRTLNINVTAPFMLVQGLYDVMENGSIINITSLNAELAFPNNPAYIASKGALKQLTKSFAMDLAKYNTRVNNIGPGYFHTNMTDKSYNDPKLHNQRKERTLLKRWGIPEDLSGLVIFLASEASSYITGQDFYIDGGWLIKGL
jgi:NAD(P)-dependent dehydrogenase (short-subunit alcohol dehydrogenase family)